MPKNLQRAAFVKKNKIFFGKELRPILNLKDVKLDGEHNISNVLAAVSMAKLYRVPSKNIQNVLRKFKGLSGREELIAEIKGTKYFNDTTATMPDAVIAALLRFTQKFPRSKIILIAGGQDKKLGYKKLAREISRKVSHLILFSGTASVKIKKELKALNTAKQLLPITPDIDSMERAVKMASKLAGKGDIVLLSPGAVSFNLFKNEFDRGEQFSKAVHNLPRS